MSTKKNPKKVGSPILLCSCRKFTTSELNISKNLVLPIIENLDQDSVEVLNGKM